MKGTVPPQDPGFRCVPAFMKVFARFLPLAALLIAAAPADASDLLSARVTAADAEKRYCSARLVSDGAVVRRTVQVADASLLRATLTGASGDWDLAVFNA